MPMTHWPAFELGHGLGGRSVHKTERVGFGEHLVTAGHLRTGLFVILIGVVGSNAGTCFKSVRRHRSSSAG